MAFFKRPLVKSPQLHWVRAEPKQFEAVVVIVHQFGGNHRQYKNLQKWWATLGFDSVSFDLSFQNWPPRIQSLNDLKSMMIGHRHLWAEQVQLVFEQIDRPMIVSSFSMPSIAALEAMVSLPEKKWLGWICEGGPFVNSLQCFWNFFKVYYPIKNPLFRLAAMGLSQTALRYFEVEKDGQIYLKKLPDDFPILSVRGWQDPIVAPTYIDQFFALATHLKRLEILDLPEGLHVDGFRKNREEYEPRVKNFVLKIAKV